MKTIDLRRRQVTVAELLGLATLDSVLISAQNGREFILEEADNFEKEVTMLGSSHKFMQFLEERSREPATFSLEDIEKELG